MSSSPSSASHTSSIHMSRCLHSSACCGASSRSSTGCCRRSHPILPRKLRCRSIAPSSVVSFESFVVVRLFLTAASSSLSPSNICVDVTIFFCQLRRQSSNPLLIVSVESFGDTFDSSFVVKFHRRRRLSLPATSSTPPSQSRIRRRGRVSFVVKTPSPSSIAPSQSRLFCHRRPRFSFVGRHSQIPLLSSPSSLPRSRDSLVGRCRRDSAVVIVFESSSSRLLLRRCCLRVLLQLSTSQPTSQSSAPPSSSSPSPAVATPQGILSTVAVWPVCCSNSTVYLVCCDCVRCRGDCLPMSRCLLSAAPSNRSL